MKTPQEKYFNDPQYHALVDQMVHMIELAQFTPSEMREAAVFACIRHEQMNIRPMFIPKDSTDEIQPE